MLVQHVAVCTWPQLLQDFVLITSVSLSPGCFHQTFQRRGAELARPWLFVLDQNHSWLPVQCPPLTCLFINFQQRIKWAPHVHSFQGELHTVGILTSCILLPLSLLKSDLLHVLKPPQGVFCSSLGWVLFSVRGQQWHRRCWHRLLSSSSMSPVSSLFPLTWGAHCLNISAIFYFFLHTSGAALTLSLLLLSGDPLRLWIPAQMKTWVCSPPKKKASFSLPIKVHFTLSLTLLSLAFK